MWEKLGADEINPVNEFLVAVILVPFNISLIEVILNFQTTIKTVFKYMMNVFYEINLS